MWGDMLLWNVQGSLLHSGDHIVPRILTADYTFKNDLQNREQFAQLKNIKSSSENTLTGVHQGSI